ncbi:hypothetical protein [Pectinatus frisingensis]|uniref:hypothetical protein n=1 Tax=Pectinatus frisingensis TaxID=865 RepID=UPI0018C5093C|nr:hypothetical protein [Pectinatus frisingensis]
MKKCFIVCPLGDDDSDIRKRSDQVYRHIVEPICKDKQYELIRSDKIHDVDKVDDTIISHLTSDDLVIADLTDSNSNALFEVGYRYALKKPLIPIVQEGEKLPFDITTIRTISYTLTDPDKLDKSKTRIAQTIDAIMADVSIDSLDNENTIQNKTIQPPFINTQILTNLLEIKDMMHDLQTLTKENNNKIVEQLVAAFVPQLQNTSTPQDKMLEYVLKEFMNDPQKTIDKFSKIPGVKFPNHS